MIETQAAAGDTGSSAARQLLSLDLVPALGERLMRLDTSPDSATSEDSQQRASSAAAARSAQGSQGASSAAEGSQGASSGAEGSSSQLSQEAPGAAEGGSQSRQGGSSAAAEGSSQNTSEVPATSLSTPTSSEPPPAEHLDLDPDTLCPILASIMHAMAMPWKQGPLCREAAAGDAAPALSMEQLLPRSAGALMLAVHCGLSATVRAAAEAGSAAARDCMAAVSLYFQHAALAGCIHAAGVSGPDDDSWAPEIRERLVWFLQLEENLPFLELLCVPLDPGAAPHCALKLEPALPGAAVPAT
jgi:hypothetical protein